MAKTPYPDEANFLAIPVSITIPDDNLDIFNKVTYTSCYITNWYLQRKMCKCLHNHGSNISQLWESLSQEANFLRKFPSL